ncbi:TetR/AcrR family transcriptional regulator [Pseudorhodoferax sp.]|uniref:TetR/AcrR family transcriptional regulator n=1 Tax=Pseudorhodoferax sp. TaxID=1993553 RepID=UPI002DD670E5|nr:TetR/AcrR family transcriptional regulator [Pseudorhodoferax sp.]
MKRSTLDAEQLPTPRKKPAAHALNRAAPLPDLVPKAADAYHHGQLRQALIASGLHQLTAEGLHKLSLRGVAKMAGVSPAAPTHHFGDKEGLLAAIGAQGFRDLTALRRSRLEPLDDPEERVRAVFSAYVEFALHRPALFQLMFGSEIANKEAHPEFQAESEDSYRLLTMALEDFLIARTGNAKAGEVAAFSLWAAAHGLATLLVEQQRAPRFVARRSVEELCKDQCSIVLEGLLALRRPRADPGR